MKCVLKPTAGLSLLELTFASGILAMSLSLLFGSLISITLVARLNEDKATANTELLSVLDEVRGMALDDLKEYEAPLLRHPGVERAISLVCYNSKGEQIPLPLSGDNSDALDGPDLPNPLEVEATLLWSNEKGQMFRATASILVAR